jgi:2-polyprenyl-6-methoxyphenol hydroxylase-like FAD-dependent oxidoreductase
VVDDVLIVGAGPVGLLLAIELVRHGLRPRIVERKNTAARFSRAIAVQPRTLELLEACGVTRHLVARSQPVRTLGFRTASHRFSWSLDQLPGPHPYVAVLPQYDTEQLLEARARELGILVERGVELVHLEQGDRVQVMLDRGRGGQELTHVGWVCGCDGGGSAVRRLAGLDTPATDPGVRFLVADVRADLPYRRDETWLHSGPEGLCAFFPLPGGVDRWRVMADNPPATDGLEPGLDAVQKVVDGRTDFEVALTADGWIGTFAVREHVAPHFRKDRVFLLGDAAHTHGPVGGQGMNTGLQDAHNLAWKLADVLRHRSPRSWLDSYEAERRPVANQVVADTGRAMRLGTARGLLPELLRDQVLGFLGGFGALRTSILSRATEEHVTYRDSPLSSSVGKAPTPTSLEAGDHVPDVVIHRELRLQSLLRTPRHTLFLFARDREHELALAAEASTLLEDRLEVFVIPAADDPDPQGRLLLPDPHGALRDTFGAAAGAAYLVRPDGYVGWRAYPVDGPSLRAELRERFGLGGADQPRNG